MVLVMALGGSTNAVLHLIAMAKAFDIDLTIDDFQNVSNRVPLIANLKPSGKYVMSDLQAIGGIPAVLKYLMEKGLIDGSCMTVGIIARAVYWGVWLLYQGVVLIQIQTITSLV